MEYRHLSDTNFEEKLMLHLYVCGMSARSMLAIENIKRICEENFAGNFELEIIDIYKNPEIAADQQIIFSPSLIKSQPLPRKLLIGTFHNKEQVLRLLGFQN